MTQGTLGEFDVFAILGIDTDELEWQDLSVCAGQDVSLFYEKYESSTRTAKLVDQMCLSCPVRAICLQAGVENGEWGTWGGVFLVNGKADDSKNSHKSPEVWKQIKEGIG